ncbi:hypothetical protein HHK36_029790 [Tetracentron sinense]|uniref:Apyrase n=1 Tax=Tetracentron sinense TaxID=13715 RepID=A0A834YFW2_TETSI|nr:hypothetical protein HHK36_029790 [Tetracentron sinense]
MRRSNARVPVVDSQQKMDSTKLQFRPNAPRSNFFSRISPVTTKNSKGNLWIFVAVAIILVVFCYIFNITGGSQNSPVSKRSFRIIIDGGSTGTRIHVFEFVNNEWGLPVFDFGKDELATMRVSPGLSSFAEDPEGAGRSLGELLEFGRGRVPKEYWGETEIRLMATAGLRRLDVYVQERVLESCRRVLRSSDFKFRDDWASVITDFCFTLASLSRSLMLDCMISLGSDEGIYAWVAANYALGTLGGDPHQTTGIVELGGASAQVQFPFL